MKFKLRSVVIKYSFKIKFKTLIAHIYFLKLNQI